MSTKKTYLFILFFFCWVQGINSTLAAQPYLGLVVDEPNDVETLSKHLDSLDDWSINYIELNAELANQDLMEKITDHEISVLIRSGHKYLIQDDLTESGEEIQSSLQELVQQVASYPSVGGIGLFSNSMSNDVDFNSAFSPILNAVLSETESTLYYKNSREWFTFNNPDEPFAVYFDDAQHRINSLHHFNSFFQQTVDIDPSLIVFLDISWLSSMLETYPQFSTSLEEFDRTGTWLIPLPEPEKPASPTSFLVVLLVILWAGLATQIKYLPYIRPMINRYFLAHRFFVDDILHYRERMATGSILMMVAHAIFGGMATYIFAKLLMNEVGLEAFFHHFPYLGIVGNNYISLSLAVVFIILITQLIMIFWIHLPAKNLAHISQSLNLYAGLLYLDFVLLTLMIPLYLTGTWLMFTIGLGVVFVLIWFASFNISAFDASKSMGADRFLYLFITIGIHFLVSLALLIFLLSNNGFTQALSLSTSL